MDDRTDTLEPGTAGRLAILISEMRSLRNAAEQLAASAGDLGDEVRHQGTRLDRVEAILATLADAIGEIHQMLVTPPVELPDLPKTSRETVDANVPEATPAANGAPKTRKSKQEA